MSPTIWVVVRSPAGPDEMHETPPNHMKSAHFLKLLGLVMVLSFAVSGCRKGPKGLTPIPGRTTSGIGETTRPVGPVGGPVGPGGTLGGPDGGPTRTTLSTGPDGLTPFPEERLYDRANYNEDREQFRQQTVYFDFDKSTVKPSEQAKVQAVAEFLRANPAAMLEIEGHCDERGTDEYNRSLGERRALAVREYLISLGIIGERINTISYGEDRPADPRSNEDAWAKNRRGEFVLLRPKF